MIRSRFRSGCWAWDREREFRPSRPPEGAPAQGVVLQKQKKAFGFFLAPTAGGALKIEAKP
jgi:hypothetical protein